MGLMALRPIVKWGDPVLHSPAASVADIDGTVTALVDDMVQTMYAAPGIGLAAPQIGIPLRVIVIDLEGKEQVYTATDLLARAFCHEIDHIDGLLFVDRLSPLKRDLLKRKLRKKARTNDWDE